jgi:uncharacterized membrane protein
MDATISEWLSLVLRWIHIIVGIAWIGASFFFMWLDAHLEKPKSPREGVEGEIWLVHSGAFYLSEKMPRLAPDQIPATLHWFKWEAYATWISGFLLLAVVYYLSGGGYLIDPSVADIGEEEAIAIGIGTLVVSWVVYDLLWNSPLARNGKLASLISFLLLVGLAYGLSQIFSARAAYVHVGAALGTIMAANVWRVIIPAQRKMLAATRRGEVADTAPGRKAKQRSTHNNYMTLPVIFVMISGHYPSTYGHEYGWAILMGLFAVAAGVRHYFNLKNAGRNAVWILPAAAVAVVALAYVTAPPAPTPPPPGTAPVSFTEVRSLIVRHCATCHSATPRDEDFTKAPKGIAFDTADQIAFFAARIKTVSVTGKAMPLGNKTGMTDAERALIGRWIDAGAETE